MIAFILKLPFHLLGLLNILTPIYWVVQVLHYFLLRKEEDEFFGDRFFRVNFIYGLVEAILMFFTISFLISKGYDVLGLISSFFSNT